MLPAGLCANLACVWEATARKPGNVHPWARSFDSTYLDYLQSAAAIASVMQEARRRPIGATIKDAILATRTVTSTNTNLGIVLLLAPLASVPENGDPRDGVRRALDGLGVEDSRQTYEAIRLSRAGGLGSVSKGDVAQEPDLPLHELMALAPAYDLVARQFVNGFRDILEAGVPWLLEAKRSLGAMEDAIISCHLRFMATYADGLIARKCGLPTAEETARRAGEILNCGWPRSSAGPLALASFDAWLRADGSRRNPGTSADMVTASLFVAIRQGSITLPLDVPWSLERSNA